MVKIIFVRIAKFSKSYSQLLTFNLYSPCHLEVSENKLWKIELVCCRKRFVNSFDLDFYKEELFTENFKAYKIFKVTNANFRS